MKIESIKPGKKDKEKLVIKTEDGAYISAYIDDGYKLRPGDEITAEEANRLNAGYEAHAARKSAARSLAKRSMSKSELSKKLRERGFSEEDTERTAEWFEERGIIDDAAYAKMCVKYYKERGYGLIRIKEELRRRGIDREISDELLADFESDEDGIKSLIIKKMSGKENDEDAKRKTINFLLRRGFKLDEIRAAMNRLRLDTEDMSDG